MEQYITPTKDNPVFQAINTFEGYVVNDHCMYKEWEVKNEKNWCVGETTATTLPNAMQALFEHIQQNPDLVKAKFVIEMIDGTTDRWGDVVRKTVYKISMAQARQFKLI